MKLDPGNNLNGSMDNSLQYHKPSNSEVTTCFTQKQITQEAFVIIAWCEMPPCFLLSHLATIMPSMIA